LGSSALLLLAGKAVATALLPNSVAAPLYLSFESRVNERRRLTCIARVT
jgi:hypothetical protein